MIEEQQSSILTIEESSYYKYSSNQKKYVDFYLEKHCIGDKLPRGKAFNKHRLLEKKVQSSNIGRYIITSLKEAISISYT